MAHGSTAYNASLRTWLIPVVTVMGSLVLVDIALSFAMQCRCVLAPRPPTGSVESGWGGEGPYQVTDDHQQSLNDVDKASRAGYHQGRSSTKAANFYVLSD